MTGGAPRVSRRWSARLFALGLGAAVVGLLALGAACSQTPPPPKEPEACKLQLVDMTILASPRINPTDSGDPRPVQTRVYQLATDVHLNNADFNAIWKDDKKALGEDLIKVQEFPVYPDSRTDVHFERDEKALVVAVVALFRSPKGRNWYTVFELPPAPGKGNCYTKVCKDGVCKDAGPNLNPHYVVWMDGTRVDTGEDRLEDYPHPGRYQRVGPPGTLFAPPEKGSPEGDTTGSDKTDKTGADKTGGDKTGGAGGNK